MSDLNHIPGPTGFVAVPAVLCQKCGSSELKRYPRDFPGTRLSSASFPLGMAGLAGRPDLADPFLVCSACGNNQQIPR